MGGIRLFIVLISLLFVCKVSLAEVTFVNPKSPEWKENVLKIISDVNNLLPKEVPAPNTFVIAYASGAEPYFAPRLPYINSQGAMEGVDRLLMLGDQPDSVLVHEYGHVIVDHYLRLNSKPWHHFLASQHVYHKPIDESILEYEKTIVNLKEDQVDFSQQLADNPGDEFFIKVLANIEKSLHQYQQLLPKLYYAQKVEDEYGYRLQSRSGFHSFMPFNELFADALSALYFQDWNVMGDTLTALYNQPNGLDGVLLPPADSTEESIELLTLHRNFPEGISLDQYQFEEWHSLTPYEQLLPTRSMIRQMVESGVNPKEMIGKLMMAIVDEYHEVITPLSEADERSLFDKNTSIMDRL